MPKSDRRARRVERDRQQRVETDATDVIARLQAEARRRLPTEPLEVPPELQPLVHGTPIRLNTARY